MVMILKKILALGIIFLSVGCLAQKNEILFPKSPFIQQQGDSLYIQVTFDLSNVKVKSSKYIVITPYIVGECKTLELPQLSINGKENYRKYKRYLALNDKNMISSMDNAYQIFNLEDAQKEYVTYNHVIAYEDWFSNAKLKIKVDGCGCGKIKDTEIISLDNSDVRMSKLHYKFVEPEVEFVKSRVETEKAHLIFNLNECRIIESLSNNKYELDRIGGMIAKVKGTEGVLIKNIFINGFSSPEGLYDDNMKLSVKRSGSLRNYLIQKYDIVDSVFTVNYGGENWEGLREIIKNSSVEHKDKIIDIIDNVGIFNGRELKLMNLDRGDPYRYMLKNIFPKLREVEIKVVYDVDNYDSFQADGFINSCPKNLSLREIFDVANMYPEGSDKFNYCMLVGAKYFPTNSVANINAAQTMLINGDTDNAYNYLNKIDKVKYKDDYLNIYGMILLRSGDWDAAKKIFEAGNSKTLPHIKDNLNLLNSLNTIEEIKKSMHK